MRADTIFSATTTFDRYTLQQVVSPNGTTSDPVYKLKAARLKGMLLPISAGNFNLITKFAMNPGDRIDNTMDRKGTSVFIIDGLEYEMFVNSCGPQVDGFGTVIGYSSILKTTAPRDFISTIDDLAAAARNKIAGA